MDKYYKKYLKYKQKYLECKKLIGGGISDKLILTTEDSPFWVFSGQNTRSSIIIPQNTLLILKDDPFHQHVDFPIARIVSYQDPSRTVTRNMRDGTIDKKFIIKFPFGDNVATDILNGTITLSQVLSGNFMSSQTQHHAQNIQFNVNILASKTNKCDKTYNEGNHNFLKCMNCPICYNISYILKNCNTNKFGSPAKRYEFTTCSTNYDKIPQSSSDKYFLVFPNEHIETITFGNAGNAMEYIINACSHDATAKFALLSYINHAIDDAVNFAKFVLNISNAKYIYPASQNYERSDIVSGGVYMVVHWGNNGVQHLHFHCFIAGNNSDFSSSRWTLLNLFDHNGIPISIKEFSSRIEKL